MRNRTLRLSVTLLIAAGVVVAGLAPVQAPQQPPAQAPGRSQQPGGQFPDVVSGLSATPGVLGVETARTASGKNVIFAWFENKEAVLRWYYSDVHQEAMHKVFPSAEPGEPLQGMPDDVGPIMAVASVTFSDKADLQASAMPISQISIELYKPITGGLFLGSRFAPASLKVPGMKNYTPGANK